MTQLTDATDDHSLRALDREMAAREELARTERTWWEGLIGGISIGGVVYFSAQWWQVLPMPAVAVLAGCAAAMPYIYFELKRLRRQVNALTHLLLDGKRSDA